MSKYQTLALQQNTYPLFAVCFDLNTLQLHFHCKANAASSTANKKLRHLNSQTINMTSPPPPPLKLSRVPFRPQHLRADTFMGTTPLAQPERTDRETKTVTGNNGRPSGTCLHPRPATQGNSRRASGSRSRPHRH